MFTTKQAFLTIIILVLVFGGCGFIVGKYSNQQSPSNTFAAGLKAAYDRLIVRGHADIVAIGYGYRESKMIGGHS